MSFYMAASSVKAAGRSCNIHFLLFNSWRSGFHGVDHHESDWEMANIYLYGPMDNSSRNGWLTRTISRGMICVAWDDQDELRIINGHPVIHAGAGSRAFPVSAGVNTRRKSTCLCQTGFQD